MRAILYNKWYELGGYRPFVPVDRSGVLLTLGGLTTLAFELGFILLIWHRYTRLLAAAMGLFFHAMNVVTLNIKFYWAMILYVTFVDWEWLSRWALRRREPLVFAYDGGCGMCRQTAAALSTATLPGGVTYTSAQDLAGRGGLPSGLRARGTAGGHPCPRADGDLPRLRRLPPSLPGGCRSCGPSCRCSICRP